MRALYGGLEEKAKERLLGALFLPPCRKTTALLSTLIRTCPEYKIVKAADKLSAYLKCIEETKSGNTEFRARHGRKTGRA